MHFLGGWPEDAGSTVEATSGSGLQTILLPGGVTIDDAVKAHPFRGGGIRDHPHGGAAANSGLGTLPNGATVQLSARAYIDGDAVLDLLVSWPSD